MNGEGVASRPTHENAPAELDTPRGTATGGLVLMHAQASAPSRDRAADALADVLELLGDPERLAHDVALATIAAVLSPDAPSRRWSLANRLLMLKAGTFDARGFRQWQHVGRKVRKRERAFHILGPRTVKRAETDPASGEE